MTRGRSIYRDRIAQIMCAAGLVTLVVSFAQATDNSLTPNQVKAGYLYNFAKFVEWPDRPVVEGTEAMVFGVLGDPEFGQALDETLAGKTLSGRSIQVRHFATAADVVPTHVLFISEAFSAEVPAILTRLADKSILSVSDSPTFIQAGGIIRFFVDTNRLRFEINPAAAKRVDLKLSSRLLRLAKIADNS